LIILEGGEGVGKSTQAKLLKTELEKLGRKVLVTKEPGGDNGVCRDIREIILSKNYESGLAPFAEFLLFEADRAQHVATVIKPALEKGMVVICDRFAAGTFAYQCWSRGIPIKYFDEINAMAVQNLKPDFSLLLDLDPATGLKRNFVMGKSDRFESEELAFHQKVRAGFLEYFKKYIPANQQKKIDASKPIEEVQKEIISALKPLLKVV